MKSEIAAVIANGLSCACKQDRRFPAGWILGMFSVDLAFDLDN